MFRGTGVGDLLAPNPKEKMMRVKLEFEGWALRFSCTVPCSWTLPATLIVALELAETEKEMIAEVVALKLPCTTREALVEMLRRSLLAKSPETCVTEVSLRRRGAVLLKLPLKRATLPPERARGAELEKLACIEKEVSAKTREWLLTTMPVRLTTIQVQLPPDRAHEMFEAEGL